MAIYKWIEWIAGTAIDREQLTEKKNIVKGNSASGVLLGASAGIAIHADMILLVVG